MAWLEYFLKDSIGRYEENNNASHDILEMPDGPAQIERDRQLCHDMPKHGFPFAWADPDLQNLL